MPQASTLYRATGRYLPFHHFPPKPEKLSFFKRSGFAATSRLRPPIDTSPRPPLPLSLLRAHALAQSPPHPPHPPQPHIHDAVQTSNARGPPDHPGPGARLCGCGCPGGQAPDRSLRPRRHLRDGSGRFFFLFTLLYFFCLDTVLVFSCCLALLLSCSLALESPFWVARLPNSLLFFQRP